MVNNVLLLAVARVRWDATEPLRRVLDGPTEPLLELGGPQDLGQLVVIGGVLGQQGVHPGVVGLGEEAALESLVLHLAWVVEVLGEEMQQVLDHGHVLLILHRLDV